MQRLRFLMLPVGLCALAAVGAHASADVLGDRILRAVDGVDAFCDALFSRWSVTAPLTDLASVGERVFFARAVALVWELVADAFLIVPLLGYDERPVPAELSLARKLLRKVFRQPLPGRIVPPLCTAAIALGGARAVAHLVRSSLFHAPLIGQGLGAATLFLLAALFASRAALRSLEYACAGKHSLALPGAVLLIPLAIAAFA